MVTFVIYVASNHNNGAFNYLFHSNMYISCTYISFILLVIFPLPIFFSSRLERERATDSSIRDLALSPRPCILSRAETASNLSRITSQTCPRPRRLASNAAVLIPRWDFYRARKFDDPNSIQTRVHPPASGIENTPVVISRKRQRSFKLGALRSRPRAKRLILDRRRLS